MNLVVFTKIPSPYQVELFDRLTLNKDLDLTVVYLRRSDPDRKWKERQLSHSALFICDCPLSSLDNLVDAADLVVFGWYRHRAVRRQIWRRFFNELSWCFWGERPGFRFKGLVGILYRRLMLLPLFLSRRAAIWGIGEFAVQRYKTEFGLRRLYCNVPYVSDLSRFSSIPDRLAQPGFRIVLFSGALIERKGITDLCSVFHKISTDYPNTTLRIMGTGPLETTLRNRYAGVTQIEFLGFRDWDELQAAYASADILCAPSKYDGWGLIVIEGMAAGMPVIVSKEMGAAFEVVKEGETGWLVRPDCPESLEMKLRAALTLNAAEFSRMSATCRIVANDFDIEAGANRFLAASRLTLSQWH